MALQDRLVEQSVLGAALLAGGIPDVTLRLTHRDFAEPGHQLILSAIQDMLRRNPPVAVDAITVTRELESRTQLSRAGGPVYLHQIAGLVPTAANAGYYAEQLRMMARVRVLNDMGGDILRTTEAANELSPADLVDAEDFIRSRIWNALDALPRSLDAEDDDENDTLEALLAEATLPIRWLIPGLLARLERVVLVSGEGFGKSYLLRQLAVCFAAGLNPWSTKRVAPGHKVLFIDAENSRDQSVRAYRNVAGRCFRPDMAEGWKTRIVHKIRNGGVDLAGKDNAWFRETVDRVMPDVLILGPAYKLMSGRDPTKEGEIMAVLDAIDQPRVQHDCAVLIEAHAPFGQGGRTREMRPLGSSAWTRWPEVGLGFMRDSDVPEEHQEEHPKLLEAVNFRPAREDRDWPSRICWGGPKDPPWIPNTAVPFTPSAPPLIDPEEDQ